MIDFAQFLYLYNGITNTNSNPSYTFDEFIFGQTIIIQFQVHFLNFRIAKKLHAKFEYTFQLICINFVWPTKKLEFSILSRRNHSFDKSIILFFKTKNA